jgi:hypothetical protein
MRYGIGPDAVEQVDLANAPYTQDVPRAAWNQAKPTPTASSASSPQAEKTISAFSMT